MRSLEHKGVVEKNSGSTLGNLVGALIGELADEVPDDPNLEAVRADVLAAGRAFEGDDKKDMSLRFYLAIRSLLRENDLLRERLKKSERERRDMQAPADEPPPIPEQNHAHA
jgi:hypothetical protein